MDWQSFFHMGGYAFEVWSTWGATLVCLIAIIFLAKRNNKRLKTEIKRQIDRQQAFKLNESNKS